MFRHKYYLVSYAHEKGFGNIFFECNGFLDIRAAEKTIREKHKFKICVVITINRVPKKRFVEAES